MVGYLPAGYPTVDGSVEMLSAMVEGGCDLLEVGMPYSDPVHGRAHHPGRRRQRAARAACGCATCSASSSGWPRRAAAVVMTYFNPVLRYGVDAFARDLAAAGGPA